MRPPLTFCSNHWNESDTLGPFSPYHLLLLRCQQPEMQNANEHKFKIPRERMCGFQKKINK